jgi:hypothetical protein
MLASTVECTRAAGQGGWQFLMMGDWKVLCVAVITVLIIFESFSFSLSFSA